MKETIFTRRKHGKDITEITSKIRHHIRGTVYEYMLIYSITPGDMMKTSSDLKAEILVALAHPNRIRIVELLRKDVMCNCELAPALELEQSNLSRHLKILVQAGILNSWKDGLRVNFKVTDDRIFKILDVAAAIARRETEKKAEALEA
jgi:DNA-binding transcriptional ArsR family regulator